MLNINFDEFKDPGLYLIWPDGKRLDLTRSGIETTVRDLLSNPEKLPDEIRAAADYKACEICPERDTAEICHSIMTALPLMDDIDDYMSYDAVTAVYRDPQSDVLQVVQTTMQEALKYITILGLVSYCEVGKKYEAYFKNINPLMPPGQIAETVYTNIYAEKRGDIHEISELIQTMQEELLTTTRCQMKRIELVSRNDAFSNAFVATYAVTDYLFFQLGKLVTSATSQD